MSSLVLRLIFLNLFCSLLVSCYGSNDGGKKVYIVYMGSKPKDSSHAHLRHRAMLEEVVGSTFAPQSIVYSYKKSFNGFAVRLNEEEAQRIAAKEGVVSVFPSEKMHPRTTRAWDFIGFPANVTRVPQEESNTIVGVFDTGIWPDTYSFVDTGYGPPPAKWKGICEISGGFRCNRKIIGARAYRENTTFPPADTRSPIDMVGHGTHVASTVAGGLVTGASLYGLGMGLARGGVPSARIAVYKVCWSDGCYDADVLAAFDDAIADGVDIISLSIGRAPAPYFQSAIGIGSFHAMRSGILTSNSAGNIDFTNSADSTRSTIESVFPWALSAGASTIDRNFRALVQLGNGSFVQGIGINTFDLQWRHYPLVHGEDIPNVAAGFNSTDSKLCIENSVDRTLVRGKILVCDRLLRPKVFDSLNGVVGVLMITDAQWDRVGSFPLPASVINLVNGDQIKLYMSSTGSGRAPTATIFKSSEVNFAEAPTVASFSSRGPNVVTPDILKPDLVAPGVNILGAWAPNAPISGGATGDTRRSPFNILSGTSAACPHATAAAVYVKTFNPTWSPAALKSALMTTASSIDARFQPDREFAYGSGQINPLKAVNPGLVYNASEIDYVRFLCGIPGFTTPMLQLITGDDTACTGSNVGHVLDLNYPSFALSTTPGQFFREVFTRTLTHVEDEISTYRATILFPEDNPLTFTLTPTALTFNGIGDTKTFTLVVQGSLSSMLSASVVWSNGVREVRSPLVIFNK